MEKGFKGLYPDTDIWRDAHTDTEANFDFNGDVGAAREKIVTYMVAKDGMDTAV